MNVPSIVGSAEGLAARTRSRPAMLLAIIGAFATGLVIARVLVFPLERDEQFYVTAGVLFSPDIYDATGFSHLPDLPLILSLLFGASGTTHYLLVARLLLCAGWIAAAVAAWRIGRDVAASASVGALLLAGLLLNPAFLDQTGMAATNNFLPVPALLWGIWWLFRATSGAPRPGSAALAGAMFGLAAGLKANYAIVVAPAFLLAPFLPTGWSWRQRLTLLALPLGAGVLVAMAPSLYFFVRDPAGFVAHVVAFHRGPQLGYWAHIADGPQPAIALRAKALIANQLWLGGPTLVIVAAAMAAAVGIAAPRRLLDRRVILLAAMSVAALAIAFVPTPGFRQYYTLPIPLLLVLVATLASLVPVRTRPALAPAMLGAATAIALAGLPILLPAPLHAIDPRRWTGIAMHADAVDLARRMPSDRRMASFGPLLALEGGVAPLPQLALGPFVYRAMDYVPARDRSHYRYVTSPATIDSLLATVTPAAIVTGFDRTLDPALDAFARRNGYAVETRPIRWSDEADALTIYRRPVSAPRSPAD